MYAIVEMVGQQFKVAKDQKVFVHRLQGKEGSKVTFENVLLLDDGKVTIGAPAIEGAVVTAKILNHLKGDKVIVFKKKRRKGYRKKNGHRQSFTEIQIESIAASGAKKATSKKEEAKPKAVKKETVKKATVKKVASKKATSKADDLKKVEGVGPKIAEIFNNAGIVTFADLAGTKVDKLKEILAEAGSRYASKNPGSWPKQAKMAADGKWDELKVWQDNIKGGIE
ncbi:MAG: 50S ribosomal protein L21 [Flavobacteriaceae bacterium]|nr:50S ribosomal protein L21 [Flavobacteriaceae bacterium]